MNLKLSNTHNAKQANTGSQSKSVRNKTFDASVKKYESKGYSVPNVAMSISFLFMCLAKRLSSFLVLKR